MHRPLRLFIVRRSRIAMCALWAMLIAVVQGSAWGDEQQAKPAWAPQLPWMALNVPYMTLTADKGEGKKVYARNAEGEYLSNIEYRERWFGMDDPIKTEYLVMFGKDTIHQLTLYFEPKPERGALIKRISEYLGECEQGASDPGAPSEYGASWIRDGVRYDLQDYGDYAEMYVGVARFQSPEAYKLSDETIACQRCRGTFWTGKPQVAYVVGLRGEGRAPLIEHIEVIVEVKDKDGISAALPAAMSRGYDPQLTVCDFDGDGQHEALVTVLESEGGDSIQAVAYSFANRKPTLLFDSSDGSLPKVSGELENGYHAVLHVEGVSEPIQVDLSAKKQALDDAGSYKDGTLSKPAQVHKAWLSRIGVTDSAQSGVNDMKCTQEISFFEGVTSLLTVEMSLKRTNGSWSVTACTASSTK